MSLLSIVVLGPGFQRLAPWLQILTSRRRQGLEIGKTATEVLPWGNPLSDGQILVFEGSLLDSIVVGTSVYRL